MTKDSGPLTVQGRGERLYFVHVCKQQHLGTEDVQGLSLMPDAAGQLGRTRSLCYILAMQKEGG